MISPQYNSTIFMEFHSVLETILTYSGRLQRETKVALVPKKQTSFKLLERKLGVYKRSRCILPQWLMSCLGEEVEDDI